MTSEEEDEDEDAEPPRRITRHAYQVGRVPVVKYICSQFINIHVDWSLTRIVTYHINTRARHLKIVSFFLSVLLPVFFVPNFNNFRLTS